MPGWDLFRRKRGRLPELPIPSRHRMADMLAFAVMQFGEMDRAKFGRLDSALVLLLTKRAGQPASFVGIAGANQGRLEPKKDRFEPKSTEVPNLDDQGAEELAQRALVAAVESQRAGLDTGGQPLSVGLVLERERGSNPEICMTFVWHNEEGRDRARASLPLLLQLARQGSVS